MAIDDSTPTKACSKCGCVYPATVEYFTKHSRNKSGIASVCRSCAKILHTAINRRNGHKPKNYGLVENGQRRCTKCHEWKPDTLEYYYADKSKPSGKNPVCKKCNNAQKQIWREANPDKVKETSKRQLAKITPERRQRLNAQQLSRYHANPQKHSVRYKKYYRDNIEYHRARGKKYRQENPEKIAVQEARRRARLLELPNTLTADEWLDTLVHFQYHCAYCGNQQSFWDKIQADHFIPITADDCPGTVKGNMIPACRHCNASKNDRDPLEWLTSKYGKRKATAILKKINDYFDSLQ